MKDAAFRFEGLTTYQRAVSFSATVYSITKRWPKEHLYSIADQLRRAGLSMSLNIVEGYSRTRKDFQHFLTLSRGSCFECIPILQVAKTMNLLSEKEYSALYNELREIAQMLSALRSALK
ncbi:four helix bundle protein [Candidatus Gottesmanbacteria bacterium]|nr:four helix bundle protein [Candidatus Gottesmanbacteria bacterium]